MSQITSTNRRILWMALAGVVCAGVVISTISRAPSTPSSSTLRAPEHKRPDSLQWLQLARQEIRNDQYRIKRKTDADVYCAPNEAHRLYAEFDQSGMMVKVQNGNADPTGIRISVRTSGTPYAQYRDSLLSIRTDDLTTEYINTEDGIRQNFIVHAKPDDAQALVLPLEILNCNSMRAADSHTLTMTGSQPEGKQFTNQLWQIVRL
ncbi:MAG: hypothetical protein SGJ05_05115 [bacterium]|nr:hypothetical protein [bacterium]